MQSVLKISEAASLAMHAAAFLAASDGRTVTTKEIAEALGASEHHLAKVLQRLSKAGLVRSARGPRGGFSLAKAAADVSLLDVYESIEGRFGSGGCLFPEPICSGRKCIMGGLLETVGEDVRRRLAGTTLNDVADVWTPARRRR